MPSKVRTTPHEVLFEGLSEDEILSLPGETIQQLILLGEPIVFKAGSAVILGSFRIANSLLVLELAHIEGGGEGVLPALGSLARRYANVQKLSGVEWIVHAVACAKPNPKLRRVLDLRGFKIEKINGVGEAYRFVDLFLNDSPSRDLAKV